MDAIDSGREMQSNTFPYFIYFQFVHKIQKKYKRNHEEDFYEFINLD